MSFFPDHLWSSWGVENGSGRGAVHGMVNCRSSARIRVRSALRFLAWKLQKISSVSLRHEMLSPVRKGLPIMTNFYASALCRRTC